MSILTDSKQKLIRKAKNLEADAIINYSYELHALFCFKIASGIAVKTEDNVPIKGLLDRTVYLTCGNILGKNQELCGKCGAMFL
ncbi:MAG: hypothetical protein ACFFEY_05705 [Candidatus Thorarchaeota archaeon]